MRLIFGRYNPIVKTYSVKEIGEYEGKRIKPSALIRIRRQIFHFFFIPMFPLSLNAELYLPENKNNYDVPPRIHTNVAMIMTRHSKAPWYNYFGLIAIALCILLFICSIGFNKVGSFLGERRAEETSKELFEQNIIKKEQQIDHITTGSSIQMALQLDEVENYLVVGQTDDSLQLLSTREEQGIEESVDLFDMEAEEIEEFKKKRFENSIEYADAKIWVSKEQLKASICRDRAGCQEFFQVDKIGACRFIYITTSDGW